MKKGLLSVFLIAFAFMAVDVSIAIFKPTTAAVIPTVHLKGKTVIVKPTIRTVPTIAVFDGFCTMLFALAYIRVTRRYGHLISMLSLLGSTFKPIAWRNSFNPLAMLGLATASDPYGNDWR